MAKIAIGLNLISFLLLLLRTAEELVFECGWVIDSTMQNADVHD